MRFPCAYCSHSSLGAASVSSLLVAWTASAPGTARMPREKSNSSPNFLRFVSVAFYDPLQTPEKSEHKSLIKPFSGPYVTSVGGTIKARPELAANISGGGPSVIIGRDDYQNNLVDRYLGKYPDLYEGLFVYARCRYLAFSYFYLCSPEGRGYPRRLRASARLPIYRER